MQVYLRPHAEARQVDAGFDGESQPRQEGARVVRLQIVEIDAARMHLLAEAVAQPVHEVVAVARRCDVVTSDLIDLPALRVCAGRETLVQERGGCVAGSRYDVEHALLLGGGPAVR